VWLDNLFPFSKLSLSVLLVEHPSTLDLTCGARGEPCCSLVEHPTLPLG
jgi:hypothetical protein